MTHYTLFDTTLGSCGIAWDEAGIVRTHLPHPDAEQVRAQLLQGNPAAHEEHAPPPMVSHAITRIMQLLAGEEADFSAVRLTRRGIPAFKQAVYDLVRAIPRGQTLSYGEVAARLGQRGAAQAVGQAMASNPFAPIVPCHRVLAADGKPGGFSAHGGALTKMKLLQMEGALPQDLLGW